MIEKNVFIRAVFCVLPCFLLAFMAGEILPAASSQDVVIIGHPDVPQGALSAQDIRQIFLGQKKSWDDGRSVQFVLMKDSETHFSFLRQYIQRSPSQFVAYWRQMLFSGKGQLPKIMATDEEIIDFVAANSGSIGYISASVAPDRVKIISVSAN